MISTLYEIFQPWSAKGSIYIISDTHFDDKDCKLMDRNWISPEEQVERLKIATKNDTLIHLGDVGNPRYMKELKCRKVLIMGNHDSNVFYLKNYFDEVYQGPLSIAEKILLSHEPIGGLDWCLNFHGHDHAGNYIDSRHLNVAANVIDYRPVSLKKIIESGVLSKIQSLHRQTIDKASQRK